MRKALLTCGLVLLLGGPCIADDAAKAILDRAITAHGGKDALVKAKSHTWKSQGKMSMGGQALDYSIEFVFAGPDKFRFEMPIPGQGTLKVATDGKNAWEQMGPMMRDMEPVKAGEFHHTVHVLNVCQLHPLLDKAFTLTAIGEIKHGDQTLAGIKASHAGKRDINLYFDKATGYLTMTRYTVKDEFQQWKEVAEESVFTGYKKQKDGRVAFEKLTIKRDGKDFIVETMGENKILDKVDDKQFAKPAGDK